MPAAAAIPIAAAAAGAIGGALGKQKSGGVTGNLGVSPEQSQQLSDAMAKGFLSEAPTSAGAETAVTQSPIFGQLYGQGGTLGRTTAEEQQLASQGFNLTPEDRTAYGQISGDISRQFGESGQSLAQALADRGLSSSGVAGKEFSGLEGNKQEQLAQLQQQIANNRYQMNLQRLGQTRNFLSQLGSGAQQAIQGEYGRELDTQTARQNQAKNIQNYFGGVYNQALGQRATETPSDLAAGLSGSISGLKAGMSAMGGGLMSGGDDNKDNNKPPVKGTQAGGDTNLFDRIT